MGKWKIDGCHIIDTIDKEGELIRNFKNILGDTKRIYTTPSAPKILIIRHKEGDPLVTPDRQKQLRMGVGMYLYLVKPSIPDISNSIRGLSQVADGANKAHVKFLQHNIKYVIDTEHLGLLLQPKINQDGFYLQGISDSEYAGDPDTHVSVYGYVLYFCGAPIV
jgi:hypothetical protein